MSLTNSRQVKRARENFVYIMISTPYSKKENGTEILNIVSFANIIYLDIPDLGSVMLSKDAKLSGSFNPVGWYIPLLFFSISLSFLFSSRHLSLIPPCCLTLLIVLKAYIERDCSSNGPLVDFLMFFLTS